MRKNVLKIVALSLLAIAVVLPYGCKNGAKKNIGLQLYSLRDDMKADPSVTVEKVGQIGYAFVEAAGYRDGKFYDMAPTDFKALVEKNGMVFLSSHTGQACPDSASWDSTMAWWDACITAHAEAGVKYIVQPWMGDTAFKSLDMLKRYCEYFNAVGEKCNAKGIAFGYHNHDREFGMIDSVVIYDFMLKNTDPAKVFFQLDLWWITVGGAKPVEYFEKYPGRFVLWHVKDEKEVGGSGKIDFAPIFAAAEKSGMKYPIVEAEEYTVSAIDGVQKSFDFLKAADYVK